MSESQYELKSTLVVDQVCYLCKLNIKQGQINFDNSAIM